MPRPALPTRRTALASLGLASLGLASVGGAALALLAGCAPVAARKLPVTRIRYGSDPSQFGELTRPAGTSKGVVVVIHGGYWLSQYGLDLGRPLAADLAARGYTAWNIEYRRIGDGGGVPRTLDDVAHAIDRLVEVDDLDLSRVVALGHSAGGHLAVWAAARGRFARWAPTRVRLTGVVSQAGVLDLRAAVRDDLGGGAATSLLDGHPDDDTVDPTQQLPLDIPVRCVHSHTDGIVPFTQSSDYVRRARAAGADATLSTVTGDHFALITTSSSAWATCRARVEELLARR